MQKTKWVVIRKGSNAANQSMCDRAVLGCVEADSYESAREIGWKRWTFYANQQIEVRPIGCAVDGIRKASKKDETIAMRADAEARAWEA